MSVIVTGKMGERVKCLDCPLRDLNDDCIASEYQFENFKEQKENCPLKSVDGLIEKIECEIEILRERNTALNVKSDGYATMEIELVSGNIKGLLDAVKIIKNYCEVEGEDGKRKT